MKPTRHSFVRLAGLFLVLTVFLPLSVFSQAFQNLNFESAVIPPGTQIDTEIPISEALPGWSAYADSALLGVEPAAEITYDGISTGGPVISIVDKKDGTGQFGPIQGSYSAFLFGGVGFSVTISQTGTLPSGTKSLMLDAWSAEASPVIAVNGNAITMIPLQTFPDYTLYEGDISSYSGQVTLSFTEPPPPSGGPSFFELDNISFSQVAVVPEPSPILLTGISGLIFALTKRDASGRWRGWRRPAASIGPIAIRSRHG